MTLAKNQNISTYYKALKTGYVYQFITMAIGLWLTPFTLKFLNTAEFALFYIAIDLTAWLGFLSLGTSSTLNSRAAHLLGSGDKPMLSRYASTAFYIQLFLSLFILIIGLIIGSMAESIFKQARDVRNVEILFFVMVFGFSLLIIRQPLGALLIASKQIHVDNYINIILYFIRTLVTVVALLMGMRVLAMAFAYLSFSLLSLIVTWFRVKRSIKDLYIRWNLFDRTLISDLLGNGMWFTIGGIAGVLILNMDSFMIGKFLSLALVTSFLLNNRLYSLAGRIHQQLFNVTRPYIGQYYGKNDLEKVGFIFKWSFKLSLLVALFFSIFIFIINQWFLAKWVGPQFYLGKEFNLLLALNFLLQSCVLPNRVLIASTLFKIKTTNLIRLIEGVLNLTLSYVLLKSFQVHGVILASVLTTIAFSNLFLGRISHSLFIASKVKSETAWNYLYILIFFPFYFIDSMIAGLTLLLFTLICVAIFEIYSLKGEERLFFLRIVAITKERLTSYKFKNGS